MKTGLGLLLLLVLTEHAVAQGVQPPPVNSFRPDNALPSVNVPEFVITGKGQAEATHFNKETVDIDSAYFQGKSLTSLAPNIPSDEFLSLQSSAFQSSDIRARLSLGSYASTSYLLSGAGPVAEADVSGSISGNYTSGFSPQTIQRDFSIQAGIFRNAMIDQTINSNNYVETAYSRGSYYLYGLGEFMQLRTTNHFDLELNSDMRFGSVPVSGGIGFTRFAVQDCWKDVESRVDLSAKTFFQLPAGMITVAGTLRIGNHSIDPPVYSSAPVTGIDRPLFHLKLGADYANSFGNFSYSVGLHYFQFSDDSSSGIGKIFPDLQGTYIINDKLALLAKFSGEVREAGLSSLLTMDRYVDASFPLRDMQVYADATLGVRWFASNELSLTPRVNILASRFYPIFLSRPPSVDGDTIIQSGNELSYLNKSFIFTTSVSMEYVQGRFSAEVDFNLRSDRGDSLTTIPNIPHFDLTAVGCYSIMPQLQLKASLLMVSGRYADLSLENKLSSVFLLDLHLGYEVRVGLFPIEIFADGRNLLDQKYYLWQNYQECPLSVSAGVSAKIM